MYVLSEEQNILILLPCHREHIMTPDGLLKTLNISPTLLEPSTTHWIEWEVSRQRWISAPGCVWIPPSGALSAPPGARCARAHDDRQLLAGVATLVCAARHQKTLHLGRRGSAWSSRAECAEKVPSSSFATLLLLLLLLLLLHTTVQPGGGGWLEDRAGRCCELCWGLWGRRGESETL